MKTKLGLKTAILLSAAVFSLPFGMVKAAGFEVPPALRAVDVLGVESVKGPNFLIEDAVTNDGSMNLFTVTAPDMSIKALGNELALERAREMEAIAAIRKIKKTEAYLNGLGAAIEGPLNSAKEAITHPIQTLENIPGAVEQFLGDIFTAVGNIGKDDGTREEESMLKDLIGYNKTKRRLAYDLGVDPYTSNPVLQDELSDLAWTGFAGGATIDVALAATTTGVGTALGAMDRVTASDDLLKESSISTLGNISRQHLIAMGLSEEEANQFLVNPKYSVSSLTRLVVALAALEEVMGRKEFIALAQMATNESEARYHQRAAEIMGAYHQQITPVAKVFIQAGRAFFVDAQGQTVMPLQADYLVWTAQTAEAMQGVVGGKGERALWLTGVVSAMTRDQLSASGVKIQERAFSKLKDRIEIVVPKEPVDKAAKEAATDSAEEPVKKATEDEDSGSGLTSFVHSILPKPDENPNAEPGAAVNE